MVLILTGSCQRRLRRALRVAAGVCAGVLGAAPLARAQTPAGTLVPNTVVVTFIGADGQPDSTRSLAVTVTVGQMAGMALVPPQSITTDPGTTVVLGHTLTNTGNGPDRFLVGVLDGLGRSARVYLDVNGDGQLDAGDTLVSAPIPLAMQQSVRLLLVVVVPQGRTQRGTTDPVLAVATSTVDPSRADTVTDRIAVRDAGIAVTLAKAVDRTSATTGDTLTYTLTWAAAGTNSAAALSLIDVLPSGLAYVAGSVRVGGQAPSGADTVTYDAAPRTLRVGLGDAAGGTNGTVSFRAVMGSEAQVANVASAAYGTPLGADTTSSGAVRTGLVLPDLHVEKALAGRSTVQVGDTLTYRIHVENRSPAVPTWSLVVADTLPAGLAFVAARPAAQVEGQVVRWTFASLGASSDARVEVDVQVTHNTVDTVRIINVASATGLNAAAVAASAAAVTVVNLGGAALTLEKSAGVLEAGLGETAPFVLTVRNTGPVPLRDIRIYDRLPAQLRLVPRSTAGADSVAPRDSGLTFFVAGPLAPGAAASVRYTTSVVAGSRALLVNTAVATAFNDVARSAGAMAFVRVRAVAPMETRAAIGKVWVDENDDGEQEPGEPGVAGVDVWTQDGDVATTDAEGRFSFRNLPTGRHAFRMDLSTVPADVRPAADAEADLEVRDGDGWTTPRVVFRLLPRAGRIRAVRVPLPWQFTARAARLPRPDTTVTDTVPCAASAPVRPAAAPAALLAPVILRGVTFATARATLLPASRAVLDRAVLMVRAVPGARVEIDGHTDSVGTRTGNLRLSLARARAVVAYLARHGIPARQLSAAGFGFDRPIAANGTAEGRALNRRVELRYLVERSVAAAPRADSAAAPAPACTAARLVRDTTRALVEYAVRIDNPYDAPVRGLVVRFAQPLDSATTSDTLSAAPSDQEIEVEDIAPRGHAVITAWSSRPSDSAAAELRGPDADRERLVAAVAAAPRAAVGRLLRLVLDSLPRADALGLAETVELLVAPRAAGWPDVTLALPDGWRLVEGDTAATAGGPAGAAPAAEPTAAGHGVASIRLPSPSDVPGTAAPAMAAGGAATGATEPWAFPHAAAHATIRDRSGRELLLWHAPDKWTPIVVTVEPVRASAGPDSLRIAPLRTTAERETERRRGFVAGPGVEFFAPTDGTVLATDRLWIGVRGEPGRAVTLLDGDSVLGQSDLRGDGVQDFVNVRLAAGPHRLRVRMDNSWGQTRWDSTAVHVSGRPASIRSADSTVALVADGHTTLDVAGQVLDAWGVPAAARPFVTVVAEGATVETADADPSSQGVQVRADGQGRFHLALRAGHDVGNGALRLTADSAKVAVPLQLLPAIRPLMVTGVGRVGVGASAQGFGAITARGRLDAHTGIVLSYDSRRLDAARDAFGRTSDPLEEAQYPILGDAGQVRTLGASRTAFAARIERGFDWLAAGDILNEGFDRELSLTDYRRALTGVAGRITTGAVTWHAFGSSTSQALRQTEVRGAGTSGPYQLDGGMHVGTERVVVETRAAENPLRVLGRELLARDADYQVDYLSGMLLLKRPVPAADTYGNPLFIVVTYEADGGGPARTVWGLRTSVDALRLTGRRAPGDSLRVGATLIRDRVESGGYALTGMDVRVLRRGLDLRAEIALARMSDSSGVAASLAGTFRPVRGLELGLRWTSVGAEFRNPSNLALRPGTQELSLTAHLLTPVADLRLEHQQQWYGAEGMRRSQTRGVATRALAAHVTLEATAVADRADGAAVAGATSGQGGELKLNWHPRSALDLWGEARHQFGEAMQARPDYVGLGARVRLWQGMALEAVHRRVFVPGTADYNVTDLGLRSTVAPGTEAYGSYQIAGVDGARNATLVGLNSHLRLGASWTVSGLFERRSGVASANALDPIRALPFLQQEEDYWSAGAGLELAPSGAPFRASARGEYRNGSLRSTRLFSLAGDISANRSLALLSRQELLSSTQQLATGTQASRRLWSLWGLAFRPTASDRLNALVKVEWLDAVNPAGGGILTNQGHEGRVIGAAEAIWAPSRNVELGMRYAVRSTRASLVNADSTPQSLSSHATFVGARVLLGADERVGFRAEGRLLVDQLTGTQRYDLAPQVVVVPVTGLEVAAGYRFGDLKDPDFAVSGGNGVFLTIGVRFTERTAATAAAYWRERISQ